MGEEGGLGLAREVGLGFGGGGGGLGLEVAEEIDEGVEGEEDGGGEEEGT